MSKVIFEMICLSNEIRYYVRQLSKKLGITVNEFLILNILGFSKCKTEKEIRKKLYIGNSVFLNTIERLVEKEYIIVKDSSLKLSKRGLEVLNEMTAETKGFFEYILTEEDKENEELIKELNQKISNVNFVGNKRELLN